MTAPAHSGGGVVTETFVHSVCAIARGELPTEVQACAERLLARSLAAARSVGEAPVLTAIERVYRGRSASSPLVLRIAAAASGAAAVGAIEAAAVLVAGADRDASLDELVTPFAIGCETHVRLVQALSPSHAARGWDATCTAGVVAGAVAASLVSGTDADVLRNAIGIAGAQVLGRSNARGTMLEGYAVGKAAANGYHASLLASVGFTGPLRVFDAERGYLHMLTDDPDTASLTDGWGDRWDLLELEPPDADRLLDGVAGPRTARAFLAAVTGDVSA